MEYIYLAASVDVDVDGIWIWVILYVHAHYVCAYECGMYIVHRTSLVRISQLTTSMCVRADFSLFRMQIDFEHKIWII